MSTEAQQPELSAQQRLAISRHALVSQLQPRRDPPQPRSQGERPRGRRASLFDGVAWAPMARGMASHWWQRHPLHAAGQLARPVLERYARDEPLKLVAAAAAIGAVAVLARPWRLLSVSTVLAAAFKTSDVAGVITTLMQRNSPPRKDSP